MRSQIIYNCDEIRTSKGGGFPEAPFSDEDSIKSADKKNRIPGSVEFPFSDIR